MNRQLLTAALLALAASSFPAGAADAQRQAEVARRGADVMPFDLKATTHFFSKSADGGIQRVLAKSRADAKQVRQVRAHLRQIRDQFRKGDFAGPAHIHGADMPGLAQLRAAQPGQVAIAYRDVTGGAELRFRSAEPKLVAALHQWFDAQLSDHGADARAGHPPHGHDHGQDHDHGKGHDHGGMKR